MRVGAALVVTTLYRNLALDKNLLVPNFPIQEIGECQQIQSRN